MKIMSLEGAVSFFGMPGLSRSVLMNQNGRGDGGLVFTNGCFDLLHPGHHHLLTEARAMGGALCVGLNSDASVRRLKGPDRPIVPQHLRAMCLADLKCVDAVVIFDEDTPIQLIQELKPDVLVKGDDHAPGSIVGADIVTSRGGRVVVVPRLRGWSTTDLEKRLSRG